MAKGRYVSTKQQTRDWDPNKIQSVLWGMFSYWGIIESESPMLSSQIESRIKVEDDRRNAYEDLGKEIGTMLRLLAQRGDLTSDGTIMVDPRHFGAWVLGAELGTATTTGMAVGSAIESVTGINLGGGPQYDEPGIIQQGYEALDGLFGDNLPDFFEV